MTDLEVTAISKLKHAELWRAAKRAGGQSALARKLGESPMLVGKWINMQHCPPAAPTRCWPRARLAKLEKVLLKLTGSTLAELFPASLRASQDFMNAPKTFERSVRIKPELMLEYTERFEQRMCLPSPAAEVMADDTKQQLYKVLDKARAVGDLTERSVEILHARFGLDTDEVMTLKDIAAKYNVSRERIRQIEANAIRVLQQPRYSRELCGLIV